MFSLCWLHTCGVKGVYGLRAFGAWHFCAGAKMPNVSIAVYVSPGRCPGLWATFGLTARLNHYWAFCKHLCLEGTTERSDGNRVRSARIGRSARCAWKALRHRTCSLYTAKGVLPSRQNYCNCFFRALRTRLPSLRSVVPSRHLTHDFTLALHYLCRS